MGEYKVTAKEMFEKLHFPLCKKDNNNEYWYHTSHGASIEFNYRDKTVELCDSEVCTSSYDIEYLHDIVNACNQRKKELGWLK